MDYATLMGKIEAFKNQEWMTIDPDYSFAHIVLADYNLSDSHIKACLDDFQADYDAIVTGAYRWPVNQFCIKYQPDVIQRELMRVKGFLEWLLTVPENIRDEFEE